MYNGAMGVLIAHSDLVEATQTRRFDKGEFALAVHKEKLHRHTENCFT